jgi:hypothetical protein
MKDEFHAQVNSLAQTRDRLVKLRTALLNKVHAHFRAEGRESRREAYDHPGNLRAALREQWPASVRLELEVIAAQDQNIVLHSDAKVPFTIKVIDSDEVNAFALPGGFFYVNKGLILAADTPAHARQPGSDDGRRRRRAEAF